MKCLALFILAAVLIAAESKVVPASDVENQQTDAQSPQTSLDEQFRQAQSFINNLGEQLRQHLPNQDELVNTFKEHSNTLATNINDYIKNVTEEYRRATSST